jgi:hypothetical protein
MIGAVMIPVAGGTTKLKPVISLELARAGLLPSGGQAPYAYT